MSLAITRAPKKGLFVKPPHPRLAHVFSRLLGPLRQLLVHIVHNLVHVHVQLGAPVVRAAAALLLLHLAAAGRDSGQCSWRVVSKNDTTPQPIQHKLCRTHRPVPSLRSMARPCWGAPWLCFLWSFLVSSFSILPDERVCCWLGGVSWGRVFMGQKQRGHGARRRGTRPLCAAGFLGVWGVLK